MSQDIRIFVITAVIILVYVILIPLMARSKKAKDPASDEVITDGNTEESAEQPSAGVNTPSKKGKRAA